jgi:hypothetical protein
MLCHASNSKAKSRQCPIEILVSKNSDSDLPAGCEYRTKVAVRNAATKAQRSYSFAVCFRICHLFEIMRALRNGFYNPQTISLLEKHFSIEKFAVATMN